MVTPRRSLNKPEAARLSSLLGRRRVHLVRVDFEVLEGLRERPSRSIVPSRASAESVAAVDVPRIDLEVPPQRGRFRCGRSRRCRADDGRPHPALDLFGDRT